MEPSEHCRVRRARPHRPGPPVPDLGRWRRRCWARHPWPRRWPTPSRCHPASNLRTAVGGKPRIQDPGSITGGQVGRTGPDALPAGPEPTADRPGAAADRPCMSQQPTGPEAVRSAGDRVRRWLPFERLRPIPYCLHIQERAVAPKRPAAHARYFLTGRPFPTRLL